MKVTVVGSGDAFGTGGRAHTCFRIDSGGCTLLVDFGASAISEWKRCGFASESIDAIVISHLHGDHFGGLPFLLLECQFEARRTRPLVLAGPPGFRARLATTFEALFPGSLGIAWRFRWEVIEIACGETTDVAGFAIDTREVVHPSGAPATAVRVGHHGRVFAYSGDTSWTEALVDICAGSDLFIVECFSGSERAAHHLDWPTLAANLSRLDSKRILVTHMGETALDRGAEMKAAGLMPAHDGLVVEL